MKLLFIMSGLKLSVNIYKICLNRDGTLSSSIYQTFFPKIVTSKKSSAQLYSSSKIFSRSILRKSVSAKGLAENVKGIVPLP